MSGTTPRSLRIALVNLRARTKDWHHIIMVPLGVMYVSAAVKAAFGDRVDVRCFDTSTHPPHDDPDEAIRTFLRDFAPDVVGIRGFTSQAEEFPIVAKIAKEVAPNCVVIAGGPHATTNSPTLYEVEEIDYICLGEGEDTFVDVIDNVMQGRSSRGTPGLGWLEHGALATAPARPLIKDLDRIPFPDYDIIDLDRYQNQLAMTDFLPKERFTSIFTSRGCHFHCTYCHETFGKRVNYRSVENVLAEIEHLIQDHGVREFHIVDDIFNADKARAIQIFNEITRRNLNIWLAFPNGLRADIMDEEFIAAAKAAGAYHWCIAVETATPRLQKLVRKFNKLDRVFETINLSDKYGVFTATFNMLGFQTETEEEMQATIDFNLRSAAHLTHFFVVTPFEGTAMFKELESAGNPELHDPALLGYQIFEEAHGHGALSVVPRHRIEELIVEATQRFFFTEARLRRLLELTAWGHNHAHLAITLEARRWCSGYTFESIPDRGAARLLARLYATARSADPIKCGHLPEPPPGLFSDEQAESLTVGAASGVAVRPL